MRTEPQSMLDQNTTYHNTSMNVINQAFSSSFKALLRLVNVISVAARPIYTKLKKNVAPIFIIAEIGKNCKFAYLLNILTVNEKENIIDANT